MPLGVISARFPHFFPFHFQVHFLGVIFEESGLSCAPGGRGRGPRVPSENLDFREDLSFIRLRQSSGLARRILRASPPAAGPPISSYQFPA